MLHVPKKTWHPKVNRDYLDNIQLMEQPSDILNLKEKYFTSLIQIQGPRLRKKNINRNGKKMDCGCRFVKDIDIANQPNSNLYQFEPMKLNVLPTPPIQNTYQQQIPYQVPQQNNNILASMQSALTQTKNLLNNIENYINLNNQQQNLFQQPITPFGYPSFLQIPQQNNNNNQGEVLLRNAANVANSNYGNFMLKPNLQANVNDNTLF